MAMPYTTRWGTKHRATDQRHDYMAQSVVYQKLLEMKAYYELCIMYISNKNLILEAQIHISDASCPGHIWQIHYEGRKRQ